MKYIKFHDEKYNYTEIHVADEDFEKAIDLIEFADSCVVEAGPQPVPKEMPLNELRDLLGVEEDEWP
jgi:hypothetical protein